MGFNLEACVGHPIPQETWWYVKICYTNPRQASKQRPILPGAYIYPINFIKKNYFRIFYLLLAIGVCRRVNHFNILFKHVSRKYRSRTSARENQFPVDHFQEIPPNTYGPIFNAKIEFTSVSQPARCLSRIILSRKDNKHVDSSHSYIMRIGIKGSQSHLHFIYELLRLSEQRAPLSFTYLPTECTTHSLLKIYIKIFLLRFSIECLIFIFITEQFLEKKINKYIYFFTSKTSEE